MGFCCRWAFPTRRMTVLSGTKAVPLSKVIPRVGNAYLQQNPISDSYILFVRKTVKMAFLVL